VSLIVEDQRELSSITQDIESLLERVRAAEQAGRREAGAPSWPPRRVREPERRVPEPERNP
jgi:hypothetical protein